MSLKPLQSQFPLGQFDALDAITTTVKGGEVVFFDKVVATVATDKAAVDAFDGYANPNYRPVVNLANTTGLKPLMLADDGVAGYGTLFGTVVGGTVGQVSYGPSSSVTATNLLGPHSATGSGKLTCWAQPGLYAVSLDAVSANLQPTLSAVVPGTGLNYSSAGLLTTNAAADKSSTVSMGTFVQFTDNGSIVSTPGNLVGTLSTPNGALTSSLTTLTYAIFWFNPPATGV